MQYNYRVATLSRGYGRRTHGFRIAAQQSQAHEIGDEPKQFKTKFPDTIVTVCEDRVLGVPKLLGSHPETEVILMDDVFQHRAITAGLSILITEYANLFTRDSLMPLGWLREAKSNYHRADIIIVSKCPVSLSAGEKDSIRAEIKPFKYQKIYFSAIQYGGLYSFNEARLKIQLDKETDVLLVCGIARYEDLKNYLAGLCRNVYLRNYRDHHRFDRYDLESIRETFGNIGSGKKIMVTTEKDAARLDEHRSWFEQNKIEIFVQPVKVSFLAGDKEQFDADIVQYIEITRQKLLNNN